MMTHHPQDRHALPSNLGISYQKDVLDHWHHIRGKAALPDRRLFRPHQFFRHLGDFAILNVDGPDQAVSIRLEGAGLGDRVDLPLGPLQEEGEPLNRADVDDESLRSLFIDCLTRRAPVFAKCFTRRRDVYGRETLVPYSVLVLPFCDDRNPDTPTNLLAAFDFSERG